MVYAYIGAALAVGLMIGIISLAVLWMAKKVTRDIARKSRQLISSYDTFMEEKSEELHRIEIAKEKADTEVAAEIPVRAEEAGQIVGGSDIVKAAEIMNSSVYRESEFDALYKTIRDGFVASPLQALLEHAPYVFEVGNAQVSDKSEAAKLLEKLDFDTAYRLSSLEGTEQVSLLSGVLSETENRILTEYLSGCEKFSIIDFRDYLKSLAQMDRKKPTLYVSKRDRLGRLPEGVDVVYDNDICEGFLLEANNKLYDYSVRGREIS